MPDETAMSHLAGKSYTVEVIKLAEGEHPEDCRWAVAITEHVSGGENITTALRDPGLWNGVMAADRARASAARFRAAGAEVMLVLPKEVNP